MKITRRRFFALGTAAMVGGGLYSRFVEPRWLAVRRVEVNLNRPVSRPIRILHLSDLHWSDAVPLSIIDAAIEQGLRHRPDLICLTGDYMTAGDGRDWSDYGPLLARLSAAAPCVACLGNHDGGVWSAARGGHAATIPIVSLLKSAGIPVLENSSIVGPGGLNLVGLSDLWSDEFSPRTVFDQLQNESDRPVIVLAHNPDTKDAIEQFSWDLMLSGHTHGGQMVMPLVGPLIVPVRDRAYVGGLCPWRDRQINISRGVGSIWGIRFYCRPEISILDIPSADT